MLGAGCVLGEPGLTRDPGQQGGEDREGSGGLEVDRSGSGGRLPTARWKRRLDLVSAWQAVKGPWGWMSRKAPRL